MAQTVGYSCNWEKQKQKACDFGKKLFKNLLVSQSYSSLLEKLNFICQKIHGTKLCPRAVCINWSSEVFWRWKFESKKKKENNESCFVSLFSKFNFDVGLLAMHGKTGIIWIWGNMVFTTPTVINISTICWMSKTCWNRVQKWVLC